MDTSAPNISNDRRIQEYEAVLRLLFAPGDVAELRAVGADTRSGCFDDLGALAAHAAVLEEEGYQVYIGLNARDRSLLARCRNDVARGPAAKATDVPFRQRLLIDIDPKRPAGVCSTKEEKRAASEVLRRVVLFLQERGWPRPLLADSGSGYHAVYRIDLATEDAGLVKGCLEALAARFNTDRATVDTAVFDPARIVRLWGTMNAKGADTQERPHRRSRVLDAAGGRKPVPPALLAALAAEATQPPPRLPHHPIDDGDAESAAPDARDGVRPAPDDHPEDDRDAVLRQARAWLDGLPPAVDGEGGSNVTYRAACGLVVDFGLTTKEARPLLEEYSSRCTPPWSGKELNHKLRDAAKQAAKEPGRVGRWRRAVQYATKGKGDCKDKQKPGDLLLEIVRAQELWYTPEDLVPYATVASGGHKENLSIESEAFQHWLAGVFIDALDFPASKNALEHAAFSAAALARHRGVPRKVFVRLAEPGQGGHEEATQDQAIYLDLADRRWRAVEVTAGGWRVLAEPPVRFRRPRGMLALPEPVRGGRIDELLSLLNVASDQDFLLLVAWLLAALRPTGPYPVLCLHGEQGTAKSTTARILRDLVDPYKARLRRLPSGDRDLMLSANNSWVSVFDNLSDLKHALSDTLCSVATGGGYATRTLYTNEDETIFDVCRPVILTSIKEVATRPDLLDRALVVQLPVLDSRKRRTERELDTQFEQASPRILGALLDGVAWGLANLHQVQLPERPRMADFAEWAAAAVPAYGWSPQDFLDAYETNVWAATGVALDDNPVVPVLRRLLERAEFRDGWPEAGQVRGIDELMTTLHAEASDLERKALAWPKRPRDLAGTLRSLAPALRKNDVYVEIGERLTTGRRATPVRIGNGKPPQRPAQE